MKIVINGETAEITDGSGNSASPEDIYSTKETRIGTWIDGKPLYRRVVNYTAPTTVNSWLTVDLPTFDTTVIDTAVSISGFCTMTSGEPRKVPIRYGNQAENRFEVGLSSSGKFQVFITGNKVNAKAIIIFMYTKKQDEVVAGNGDYSVYETRIGTWIDGEPLYRIVITGTAPSSSNVWTDISANILIGTAITMSGYVLVTSASSGYWLPIPYGVNNGNAVDLGISSQGVPQIKVTGNKVNMPYMVILEYTKTIDQGTVAMSTSSTATLPEVATIEEYGASSQGAMAIANEKVSNVTSTIAVTVEDQYGIDGTIEKQ